MRKVLLVLLWILCSLNLNSQIFTPRDYDQKIISTGGSIMYLKNNSDGTQTVWYVNTCYGCSGYNKCQMCQGTGQFYYGSYLGYRPCNACGATGSCSFCKGKGYIVTTCVSDANGNVYAYDEDGNVHTNSGSYSSSSSSSSSRTPCPVCRGKKYEHTSYSSAASSAYGWKQPYHHRSGKCPICGGYSEHYHYPCNECHGYGTIKN